MSDRRPYVTLFLLLVLPAVPACSGRGQAVGEVEGTVLWNKRPLKNVQVQFLPDVEKGTTGPRSTAMTDDEGRYALVFDDDQPGAVVGYHRVLLLEIGDDPDRDRKAAENRKDRKARPKQKPSGSVLIPDKYRRVATTPLKHEVQPGKQTIDFNLP
jgi:hypothetical protein